GGGVLGSDQTDEALQGLAFAAQEARSLGQDYFNTEHYLLGLVGQTRSSAAHILKSMGVSYKKLRLEAKKLTGCEAGHAVNIPFSQRTGTIFGRSEAVAEELE